MAHSREKKAAVMAALLAGQGISEIAAEYDIPESTVRSWRDKVPADQLREAAAKRDADLGVMIGDYLTAILQALTAQAGAVSDPEWIKKQPADELGVLHGILADKGFRLIGAIQQVDGGGE